MEELLRLSEVEYKRLELHTFFNKRHKFVYSIPNKQISLGDTANKHQQKSHCVKEETTSLVLQKEKSNTTPIVQKRFFTRFPKNPPAKRNVTTRPKIIPKSPIKSKNNTEGELKLHEHENKTPSNQCYENSTFNSAPDTRIIKTRKFNNSFERFKQKSKLCRQIPKQKAEDPTKVPDLKSCVRCTLADDTPNGKENNGPSPKISVLKFSSGKPVDKKKPKQISVKRRPVKLFHRKRNIHLYRPGSAIPEQFPLYRKEQLFTWDIEETLPEIRDNIVFDDDAATRSIQYEYGRKIVSQAVQKALKKFTPSMAMEE